MKISLRTLAVFALIVVLIGIYIAQNRKRNLPDGKMTRTETLNLPDDTSAASPVIPGRPRVTVNTSRGSFDIELRPDIAPRSVVNFLGKWSSGFCNSKTFHRVENWVIQGCDPKGDGTGGKDSLPTETSSAGSFIRGSVGVARKTFPKDISNDSQFFIIKKDTPSLDNDYTYLGRVISGMDVVDSITKGDSIISTTILTK